MSLSSAAEEAIGPNGKPVLETIASEVKYHIFSYLPQETLYCLLLSSPALSEEAAILLYHSPKFRTTYRFAQFVTTVSHSRRYADMVRVFDLSDRKEAEDRANGFASWREWKYREIPLYAAQAPPKQLMEPKKKIYKGTHPGANYLFNKTSVSMPLNFAALTSDDLIESLSYPSSAISGLVFGSDLARSWTQGSADVESVRPDFLILYLTSLFKLENVQVRNAPWLTGADVQGILRNCPRVKKVDFRGSGKLMRDQALVVSGKTAKWEIHWAIKGSRKECAATLPAGLASESLAIVSNGSERRNH
ncbi:MAG: hypothetical protein Q9175_004411 [Cornicularia normoerica]